MRKKLATSLPSSSASPSSSPLMGFTVAISLFMSLMTLLYLTT